MPEKIIILGSSNSIPDLEHGNSHMIYVGKMRQILIDSSGDPIVRLRKAGIDPLQLTDIILTHFHPDHVSGIPMLLMDLWLLGRKEPLRIFGIEDVVWRMKKMLELYDWGKWPGLFPVSFSIIKETEGYELINEPGLKICSSPVKHLIPTIGLRIETVGRKSVTYTCDTEPCEEVIRLAQASDILIHETAGEATGHSSARQAGNDAKNAMVNTLYLIHYPPSDEPTRQSLIYEARETFAGEVKLASDYLIIPLD